MSMKQRPLVLLSCWKTVWILALSAFHTQLVEGIASFRILDEQDASHNHSLISSHRRSSRRSSQRVRPNEEAKTFSIERPALQKNAPSLSSRFSSLMDDTNHESFHHSQQHVQTMNDFRERLLAEEQQQQQQQQQQAMTSHNPSAISTSFLWKSAFAGLILISASSWIATGSASTLWTELTKTSVSSLLSVVWLPFLWIRPGNQMFWEDIWTYGKLFGTKETVLYIKNTVLPSTIVTLRKMLVAELWTRFWTKVFHQVGQVFRSNTKGKASNKKEEEGKSSNEEEKKWLPNWLVEGHSFVVSSIRRRMKTIIKGALQKHLQGSIITVSSFVFVAVQEYLYGSDDNVNDHDDAPSGEDD